MPSKRSGRPAESMLLTIAIVAVLHFAEPVVLPVAQAIMLTVVPAPLVTRVERWGARRPLAVVLTCVVVFAVVGTLVWVVASQFPGAGRGSAVVPRRRTSPRAACCSPLPLLQQSVVTDPETYESVVRPLPKKAKPA